MYIAHSLRKAFIFIDNLCAEGKKEPHKQLFSNARADGQAWKSSIQFYCEEAGSFWQATEKGSSRRHALSTSALVLTCVLKCNSVARREQSLMWDAYGFMGSGFRRARLTSLRG